jgi:hypothetical protein
MLSARAREKGSSPRAALHQSLNDLRQRATYVGGLKSNLRVRESERGESRRGEGLIPPTISVLLAGRAVVTQAVGLHHQTQLWPVEVRSEATQVAPGFGHRKVRGSDEPKEVALELGVGQREGSAIEQPPHDGGARLPPHLLNRHRKGLGVDQIEFVGLAHGCLKPGRGKARREVNQGPSWARDRDAEMYSTV